MGLKMPLLHILGTELWVIFRAAERKSEPGGKSIHTGRYDTTKFL